MYLTFLFYSSSLQYSTVNCFTKINCWGVGSKKPPQAVQSKIGIFWKEKGSTEAGKYYFEKLIAKRI